MSGLLDTTCDQCGAKITAVAGIAYNSHDARRHECGQTELPAFEAPEPSSRSPRRSTTVSGAAPTAPAATPKLVFRTPLELAKLTPIEVPWLWRDYVAVGAITSVEGPPKAAGKTTLLAHLIRAALKGEPFLDRPTMPTPVIWLTEQSQQTFCAVLARAKLLDRADLHVLTWGQARGMVWPAIVAGAVSKCRSVGAKLLIVDTLPQFAGLGGDRENDAGAMLDALRPLQEAAGNDLAVVAARHERKSGGDVGEAGRGSNAATGAVDIVLSIRRPDSGARPTVRLLHALSRFDETPTELAIELTEDGYRALGSGAALAVTDARQAILDVLPSAEAAALCLEGQKSIMTALTGRAKRSTVQQALADLTDEGLVARTGVGKRGKPHRYWLIQIPVGDSARGDGQSTDSEHETFRRNDIPLGTTTVAETAEDWEEVVV